VNVLDGLVFDEKYVDGANTADGAPTWREVHARLLSLRARRAQLDHEELVALRDAMRLQVWREVGRASMREYLEHTLGYGPRAANERLRVAGALDAMPVLEKALRSGELPYSAIREISRVAISTTEEDWVDACRGKNLRQIEELVSQRAEGDLPDSPRRPELQKFVVRLELNAAEYALWRQARQQIQDERKEAMEEHAVFAAMCTQAIEGPAACTTADPKQVERRRGRAKYQIAVTICKLCKQGWQHGGSRLIAIEPADIARAECDAQRIGSLEGQPTRATQDIPPKTRRFVLLRDGDGDRCTVPGCRSARFIEVHHIEHQENGGDHQPENLTSLCGGHHDAHHRGTLIITGSAPDLQFEFREPPQLPMPDDDHAHVESVMPHAQSESQALEGHGS
jgi:5-methylcytosine-specific restriction endonuclease McrA